MQSNNNDWEDKLLNNSLLFSSIRKKRPPEEKIKKIQKYLDRGADINATDANHKNNTPLHIAVMKEEPEVVGFLLQRGAVVNKQNRESQTALDIARLLPKSSKNNYEIASILEEFYNNQQDIVTDSEKVHTELTKITRDKINAPPGACNNDDQMKSSDVTSGGLLKNKKEVLSKEKHEIKKTKGNKLFNYQKRSGTSGLSGQLYETKLLSLILFRALYVQEVKSFTIATNVDSMGAFDDIVFRFNSNKGDKPKIMFLQAKHKDNPEKDKLTVEEIMRLNGDFSLHKYLESYIKISQMFVPENSDDMFRGEFKNMDCEFIIYTSAFERFSKMKIVKQFESQRFINTTKSIGQTVFQFDCNDNDMNLLMQTVAKSRAVHLAKRLSKFIFKDNYNNMMLDDLVKTYHVYLARDILEIQDGETGNNFLNAKFRETFFSSNDSLLLAFKATLCKELLLLKKDISPEKLDDVEGILSSLTIKVPMNFGNLNFCFSGSEQKQEKKLEYLYSKIKKLFANANVSENIVIKVDDNMVGPNEILQSTDLESYRLGGLVGNLLILDDDSKTLKFNSDINTLSADNLKLYEKLKSDVNIGIDKLSKCRFDINVRHFPRLSLIHNEYDKNLIEDFLDKLVFYSNQATEDEVERILKKEIDKYFVGSIPRKNDALFRVKGDAIFLKVHDRVQKWWKQPSKAPYLTESCKFFFEAEQDILNSPLLSILNFTYTKTIKNALPALKFKNAAIELLHLDVYFGGSDKILSIITEENALSGIKLIQYFKEQNFNDYSFIDLDYVGIGNYFVDVKSEVTDFKINTLIIVCKSQDFIAEVLLLIKQFKGRVIIICNWNLSNQIKGLATENFVERVDSQTSFSDLADSMRTMLLKDRYIVFQGKEVPLGILLEEKSYHLLTSNLLYMIINNEKITIGNGLNNPAYDEILDFYINEQVCRYVILDSNVKTDSKLNVIKYDEKRDIFIPDIRDIILITDKQEEFEEFIKMHVNCTVHWFRFEDDKCLVWQKSQGSLQNLLKHIHRGSHDSYTRQPVTLKDLKDKVVIISAEPGMGKSSLLTHLAINTKQNYPALWISKINLLENSKELRRMKEHKVNIDLKEAVKCLFRLIGFEAYKKSKSDFETMLNQVIIVDDNITFNKNTMELNFTGLNLFEIELFIYCYNNDRVIVLFDGFDEICPDFANEFMQLANILKKSKVVHLWITSRLYNVLHQLENTLETFSFTIKPLTYDNQLEFLEKIWLSKGSNKMLSYFPFNTNWGMQNAVKGFLKVLSAVLGDTNNKFISMPLHLYMISEIFQDSFHNFPLNPESMEEFVTSQNTMNMVNLNLLYERFVDVKFFKIRFGEKKPLLCINDPDMRKLIDNERTAFYNSHKIIAAYVIFGKSNVIDLFDNYEINEVRNFVERIKLGEEKTGIIEQIIQNEPKFVHYTFAEYFATEFLCDRLKSFNYNISLWTYFVNTFLQSEDGGPRRFFNAKLGNHPLLLHEMYNTDINELFENLLTQRVTLTKLIFMAIDEYLENSAIFLLKCLKTVLNKNNLDNFINVVSKNFNKSCIICMAAKRDAKKAVKLIIKLVKDIDGNRLIDLFKCSDLPKYNPVVVAFEASKGLQPNEGLLDILLSDLPSSAIVELCCIQFDKKWFNSNRSKKLIHLIAWHIGDSSFNSFDKVLDKLNMEQLIAIFSVRDSEKKLAAHRAASEQCYTFFDKLDSLLDRSHFKEICMTRDRSGLTPLHYFKYSKKDCEKLKIILDKVYEDNTNEKLTLYHFTEKNN
ncbi:hypothetical protein PYW07_005349 [Mythimna separata]|uniref:NACHT domain-containing protein n=1 Tax=Mythimna separata TaxID=271217 RepID=A0AAD8DPV9_MYTSE|nr:hypothetical protein PYW07_005349 [Mythimna separata]